MKFAITSIFIGTILISIAGCATTPEKDDSQPKTITPALYTLKEGEKIEYKSPLPNKTKVYVDWTFTNGTKSSQEGFRGWDVDHDGRFDMLEVLDKSGKPMTWAYDFNGDGVIDVIENEKNQTEVLNQQIESH